MAHLRPTFDFVTLICFRLGRLLLPKCDVSFGIRIRLIHLNLGHHHLDLFLRLHQNRLRLLQAQLQIL